MTIDSAWSRDFKVFIRLETYDFKKNEELCDQSTSIAMLTDSWWKFQLHITSTALEMERWSV